MVRFPSLTRGLLQGAGARHCSRNATVTAGIGTKQNAPEAGASGACGELQAYSGVFRPDDAAGATSFRKPCLGAYVLNQGRVDPFCIVEILLPGRILISRSRFEGQPGGTQAANAAAAACLESWRVRQLRSSGSTASDGALWHQPYTIQQIRRFCKGGVRIDTALAGGSARGLGRLRDALQSTLDTALPSRRVSIVLSSLPCSGSSYPRFRRWPRSCFARSARCRFCSFTSRKNWARS
jgi:hypothetical protein